MLQRGLRERLRGAGEAKNDVSYVCGGLCGSSYIDWMVSVPWVKRSKVKHDLKRAARILDEDHFGLDEVKDRILEYLAVQKACPQGKRARSVPCGTAWRW